MHPLPERGSCIHDLTAGLAKMRHAPGAQVPARAFGRRTTGQSRRLPVPVGPRYVSVAAPEGSAVAAMAPALAEGAVPAVAPAKVPLAKVPTAVLPARVEVAAPARVAAVADAEPLALQAAQAEGLFLMFAVADLEFAAVGKPRSAPVDLLEAPVRYREAFASAAQLDHAVTGQHEAQIAALVVIPARIDDTGHAVHPQYASQPAVVIPEILADDGGGDAGAERAGKIRVIGLCRGGGEAGDGDGSKQILDTMIYDQVWPFQIPFLIQTKQHC